MLLLKMPVSFCFALYSFQGAALLRSRLLSFSAQSSQTVTVWHNTGWLPEKIGQKRREDEIARVQRIEKSTRQNRKRPTALKEEILKSKHRRSEKKDARRKIRVNKVDQWN